jgi:hypothetical protein
MRSILALLFCCLFSGAVDAQKKQLDTSRYKVALGSFWKTGDKVWRILTDVLPRICPQLSEKQMCVDPCDAAYSVVLNITRPSVINRSYSVAMSSLRSDDYIIRTYYQFTSSLFLIDANGSVLVNMVLVDTNEVFFTSEKVTIEQPTMQPGARFNGRPGRFSRGEDAGQWTSRIISSPQATIMNYMNRPYEMIAIRPYELLKIVNNKLYALNE